jgi:hypothetical protein
MDVLMSWVKGVAPPPASTRYASRASGNSRSGAGDCADCWPQSELSG